MDAADVREAVHRLASVAQVVVGTVVLDGTRAGTPCRTLLPLIPDVDSSGALLVVRSMLARVVCRIAAVSGLRIRPEFLLHLSQLMSAETTAEVRTAYGECVAIIDADEAEAMEGLPSDRRVRIAILYIRDHCCDGSVSLGGVAQRVRLSPWHFDRLLKRSSGRSFREHLRSSRMTIAERLLSQGLLTVKEIAANLGYSNPSNFDRDFKRTHGLTPSGWRHDHQHSR